MKLISKWRVAAALFLALAALFLLCGAARADGLVIHFLDIDRNDGILIQCDGEAAFIDAGTYNFAAQAVDYMQAAGVNRLKYYIGTHAHKDHVGGACKIILAMTPGLVLQPHDGVQGLIAQNARTQEEIAAVRAASYLNVAPGQTFSIGGARLTVLGPLAVTRYKNYTSLENNNSLVCRLTYGGTSILFTGDATAAELNQIESAAPGALRCDVLKNPHHNGTLKASLLAACAPQYVVYSTSDRYLPTQATLREVASLGARALITAHKQNGTVVFRSNGRALSYTVSNGPTGVSLNKSAVTVYEGRQQTVAARLTPSSFRAVTYVSQNTAVATVDGAGRITGVGPGATTVRALASNGLWDECAVTVLSAGVKLSRTALTLRTGATAALKATLVPSGSAGKNITWSSDNPAVATVSSSGKVSGVAPGETTVRAVLASGTEAACAVTVSPVPVSSVKVSPGSLSVTIGETRPLSAAVGPKNATDKTVAWSSADERVAQVSADGLVTAVGVGKTTVTATAGGKSRAVNVTVKPVYVTAIAVSGKADTLTAGVAGKNTLQLTASIQPQTATIQTVAWKSSNSRVAVVDENGLVTAVAAGRATIYAVAQDGSRKQGAFRLTVAANQFNRPAALINQGRLTVSARQLTYERDYLKVVLYYANFTDQPLPMPAGGVLTFTLPDGKSLAVVPLEPGKRTVRKSGVATYTLKLPLADCPQLAGLDLSACDATVTG